MRSVVKVVPLGVLGYAAALLVACGGSGEGLLPDERAAGLREALVVVQSACAAGEPDRAQRAAQSFADRVAELSAREVDPELIANLEKGAARLQTLAGSTCDPVQEPTTTPTTTVPTTTTPTTTVPTTTTTAPTTTTPTTTTPTTTTPNGGGTGEGPPGGVPPGQAKRDNGGAGASP
jgi:hypothetical protein